MRILKCIYLLADVILLKNMWILTSMFERAIYSGFNGVTSSTVNLAFMAGSSKHGKACLAYVGSNLDVAISLQSKY